MVAGTSVAQRWPHSRWPRRGACRNVRHRARGARGKTWTTASPRGVARGRARRAARAAQGSARARRSEERTSSPHHRWRAQRARRVSSSAHPTCFPLLPPGASAVAGSTHRAHLRLGRRRRRSGRSSRRFRRCRRHRRMAPARSFRCTRGPMARRTSESDCTKALPRRRRPRMLPAGMHTEGWRNRSLRATACRRMPGIAAPRTSRSCHPRRRHFASRS